MRITIGVKIFSIAVALLLLMGAVAWINLRMTRTVDAQLVVIDKNYFPAVIGLAQAHIHKLEESSTSRRLVAALLDGEARAGLACGCWRRNNPIGHRRRMG